MTSDRRDLSGAQEGLTHNPFAKLRAALPGLPASPSRSATGADGAASVGGDATQADGAATTPMRADAGTRVVVRVERKGHGGKTVTRIEGLLGDRVARADFVKALRRALGAGARSAEAVDAASAEGAGDIVVQGEHVDRVVAFLQQHGVRNVVRGNR
ncbi:MAG: translation initiation factor [Planctomycetota bacterium]